MRPSPLFVVLACACVAPPSEPGPAPANPFLADSAWPVSHQSPWAQASSALPVPTRAEGARVDRLETGFVSITTAFAPAYGDGVTVAWLSSATAVRKVELGEGPPRLLAEIPRSGGLADLIAGAYTLVDVEGRLFSSEADRLVRFDDDLAASDSPIVRAAELSLPDPAEDETIVGLGLAWDGHVVFATSAARVGVATRDLELLDLVAIEPGASVSNSIATDADGAVYVVTSRAMHRVQWTGEALSLDEADGAWAAPYRVAEGDAFAGRLGVGSGSTPTMIGEPGGDRLVAITDGQALMHVVLFWAGPIPDGWDGVGAGRDPRIAAETPVTFGDPDATTSVSEQSILASGWGLVVVNNDYGETAGSGNPVLAGVAPPGVEQLRWDPSTRRLTSAWVNREVSCPNGIPAASRAAGLALCVGRRGTTWTLEALDWADGTSAYHVPLGDDPGLNSVYAATAIGPGGQVVSGTLAGLVRVRPPEETP